VPGILVALPGIDFTDQILRAEIMKRYPFNITICLKLSYRSEFWPKVFGRLQELIFIRESVWATTYGANSTTATLKTTTLEVFVSEKICFQNAIGRVVKFYNVSIVTKNRRTESWTKQNWVQNSVSSHLDFIMLSAIKSHYVPI
jgi:hypothetical protein